MRWSATALRIGALVIGVTLSRCIVNMHYPRLEVSLRSEAAELDEVQPERLDLGQYTVECRPIQKPGEQRVSTFQLRNHVWECRQRRRAEIAVDADRVRIWRVIHT